MATQNEIAAKDLARKSAADKENERHNKVMEDAKARDRDLEKEKMKRDTVLRGAQTILGKGGLAGTAGMIAGLANHPEWYAENGQLLSNAANLAFGQPSGSELEVKLEMCKSSGVADDSKLLPSAVPGVLALYYAPSVGVSSDASSAINVAAQRMYSWVRHANSGSRNYDPVDLMLYVLNVADLYSYRAMLIKAYGLILQYNQVNRYWPAAILRSMGLSATDLAKHIPDLRYYINYLGEKISAFVIPDKIHALSRQAWMQTSIYKEFDSDKAPLYHYVQSAYRRYELDPTNQYGKSACRIFVNDLSDFHTFDSLVEFGESLLNPLFNMEDYGIISGDILKAYGSNIMKVQQIADNYKTPIIVYPKAVWAIKNATCVGNITYEWVEEADEHRAEDPYHTSFDIVQRDGVLISEPRVITNVVWNANGAPDPVTIGPDKLVLTTEPGLTSPADVMSITRLMCKVKNVIYTNSGPVHEYSGETRELLMTPILTCGTEVPLYYAMFTYDRFGASGIQLAASKGQSNMAYAYNGETDVNAVMNIMNFLAHRAGFWYAPRFYTMDANPNAGSLGPSFQFLDADEWAILSEADLKRMNEVALLSEYWAPQMGSKF